MTAYQYELLPDTDQKHIRLLQLLPGCEEDAIYCSIQVEHIDNVPRYEAISYVWGDRSDTAEVLCHGLPLSVPANLVDALRRFRKKSVPRMLWADAICINQKNIRERGEQVPLMGKIFAGAKRVLVWLGRGEGINSQAGFDLVKKLALKVMEVPIRDDLDSVLMQYPSEAWEAFSKIMWLPWFNRMWVLQEIGLASEARVFCGRAVISWDALQTTCFQLHFRTRRIKLRYSLHLTSVVRVRRIRFKDGEDMDVRAVLHRARHRESSDPSDKVYALLSHPAFKRICFAEGLKSLIPVDYSKSCAEVNLSLAGKLLQQPEPLRLLSHVIHGYEWSQEGPHSPSWVPRWDDWLEQVCFDWSPRPFFEACSSVPPELSFHGSVLEVTGLVLDRVVWCSKPFDEASFLKPSNTLEGAVEPLKSIWLRFREVVRSRSKTEGEAFEALCLTLNAGGIIRRTGNERAALTDFERVSDALAYFGKLGINIDTNESLQQRYGTGGDYIQFVETTRGVCLHRRVFITADGHIGIGPSLTKPEDVVCVLFGGRVPFIL